MVMGYEDSKGTPQCPYPMTQPVETKLWTKGYVEARFKWKMTNDRPKFVKKFAKPFQKPKMFTK